MKRLLACVSFVVATTTAASSASAPNAVRSAPASKKAHAAAVKCKVAPADEYFGKLQMSILGIRNVIRDQGAKVDIYPEKAPSTVGAIAMTEDALRDWQRKYPCDSWLPGTIYALEHFWAKFHTEDGVKHVHATFAWLRRDFPRSRFVGIAHREDAAATRTPPGTSITATADVGP